MKDPKNSSEKLKNLIEAFSELSENDMEEARAIIISAGKNPEDILNKGLGLITSIKSQRKSILQKNTSSGSFGTKVFVRSNGNIDLVDSGNNGDDLLDIQNAYSLLMGREEEGSISSQALGVKLMRYVKGVYFNISIGAEYATVECFLATEPPIRFSLELLPLIEKLGYLIHNNVCYPVERESSAFAMSFIKDLDGENRLLLKTALSYFAQKNNYPSLHFEQQELDFNTIFSDEQYKGVSQLFTKTLYDYQSDGLKWLMYCCINRLGGILADDMGLGKTAQIIALIASVIERNILGQVLIVVPSTLLENWRREFLFFAPEIVPFIHHGSERTGSPTSLGKQRVVITSYSMIINDLYLFNKIKWGMIILDEASLIKNPDSERKTALSLLSSEVNIAMTGTPVENSLMDLWSIADFVRKGYLGTKKEFNANYKPKFIGQGEAETAIQSLRELTSYLMLRRRKEAVLDSLPPRVDIHQALAMGNAEILAYELERKSDFTVSNSPQKGAFLRKIVEMRMFTTHPMLRGDLNEMRGANLQRLSAVSTKFARTIEILSEIKIKNEKVIIFTEFIEMIDVFQRVISSHFKIPVWRIDGRVETEERQLNIDKFKKYEGFTVMVLNPRTAGMGLNITAANHVIHYTRQWNPALEEQASARAYRNGQNRGVNIYYLYYSQTIEEVIDGRLRYKKSLSEDIIVDTEAENMEEYINALKITPNY